MQQQIAYRLYAERSECLPPHLPYPRQSAYITCPKYSHSVTSFWGVAPNPTKGAASLGFAKWRNPLRNLLKKVPKNL